MEIQLCKVNAHFHHYCMQPAFHSPNPRGISSILHLKLKLAVLPHQHKEFMWVNYKKSYAHRVEYCHLMMSWMCMGGARLLQTFTWVR